MADAGAYLPDFDPVRYQRENRGQPPTPPGIPTVKKRGRGRPTEWLILKMVALDHHETWRRPNSWKEMNRLKDMGLGAIERVRVPLDWTYEAFQRYVWKVYPPLRNTDFILATTDSQGVLDYLPESCFTPAGIKEWKGKKRYRVTLYVRPTGPLRAHQLLHRCESCSRALAAGEECPCRHIARIPHNMMPDAAAVRHAACDDPDHMEDESVKLENHELINIAERDRADGYVHSDKSDAHSSRDRIIDLSEGDLAENYVHSGKQSAHPSGERMESERMAKLALVTGSTGFIGQAIAHALAKKGCNIILHGFGTEEDIAKIKCDISQWYGVCVDYAYADLRKAGDIQVMVNSIKRHHPEGVDILVNNAGVLNLGDTEQLSPAKFQEMLDVLVTAPFLLTQQLLPEMKSKGWGRIVNIASIVGLTGMAYCTGYGAAKAGLIGLTKGVALEGAGSGVTCNAVCPGTVDGGVFIPGLEAFSKLEGKSLEQKKRDCQAAIPTGKLCQPQQVADLVDFLCFSAASSQMTGSSYVIDGGSLACTR